MRAESVGEQVCVRDRHCTERRTSMAEDRGREIGTRSDIPVRRFGTIPLLDDEPTWEIEADAPRTIAEFGGTTVLLAALVTAAIGALLLYLR